MLINNTACCPNTRSCENVSCLVMNLFIMQLLPSWAILWRLDALCFWSFIRLSAFTGMLLIILNSILRLKVYPPQEVCPSCIHTDKYAPYQKVCWVRFQYLVVYPRQEVYQSCIHTERSDPIKRCDGFVSNTKRCIHIKRCDSLYPHWEVHPISKSVLDLYPIPRGVSQGHKVYLGVYGMLIWHLKA